MCGWTGNEGIEVLVLHQKVGRSFSCVTTEVLLYFLLHGCIIQSWNLRLFAGPHMKVHCICFSPLIILKLSQLCFQGRKKENEKFHVQWACSVFRCVMVFQTAQTPHWGRSETPQTSRAVKPGAPGALGVLAAPPVGRASWAGRDHALQGTRCTTAGVRTSRGRSVSIPPVLVRTYTETVTHTFGNAFRKREIPIILEQEGLFFIEGWRKNWRQK